jgi:hypothetical protein
MAIFDLTDLAYPAWMHCIFGNIPSGQFTYFKFKPGGQP